jgi:hypothetical protein
MVGAYRSRLSLGNQISSEHGRLDRSLLNSRRLLETVRVNTTEELFGDLHTVEGLNSFVPVGVKVSVGQAARGALSTIIESASGLSLTSRRWYFTVVAKVKKRG